jgi:hypothetical protein
MPTVTVSEFKLRIKSWSKEFRKSSQSWRQFKECGSDAARFRLAHLWPPVCDVDVDLRRNKPGQRKCPDEAKKMVRTGDSFLAKKKYNHALTAYNHAIVAAPWTGVRKREESCQLTLVLDKRSAVFLVMRRFADCIRDVDDALLLGSGPKYVLSIKTRLFHKKRSSSLLPEPFLLFLNHEECFVNKFFPSLLTSLTDFFPENKDLY